MKSIGTLEGNDGLWHAPNLGATNAEGFTAIPGGGAFCCNNNSEFQFIGTRAYYWTSTGSAGSYSWRNRLYYDSVEISPGYDNNLDGYSVRCIKD